MTSGGARARSGPPPDPNALRRARDAHEWWTLPAEGRTAPAPKWPLTRVTKREAEVWKSLWAKPQAVAWEALGQEFEVALYTRRLVEAEKPLSQTSVGTLVRQLGEALGLSVPGLARNRWRIGQAEQAPTAKPADGRLRSARNRLKVVDGGGD